MIIIENIENLIEIESVLRKIEEIWKKIGIVEEVIRWEEKGEELKGEIGIEFWRIDIVGKKRKVEGEKEERIEKIKGENVKIGKRKEKMVLNEFEEKDLIWIIMEEGKRIVDIRKIIEKIMNIEEK